MIKNRRIRRFDIGSCVALLLQGVSISLVDEIVGNW